MDKPSRKRSIFWRSSERYLSGLKILRFYPKYQKTIFSDFIIAKNPYEKKFDISTKTMDYLLKKMPILWHFLKH